jgi:hypothetical protein
MFFKEGDKKRAKERFFKTLLGIALVMAVISQFALPAMADMVVEQPAPGFLPTTVSTASTSQVNLYTYTVPNNCTATCISLYTNDYNMNDGTVYVYVNGVIQNPSGAYDAYYFQVWNINASAGSTIQIQGKAANGLTLTIYGNGSPYVYEGLVASYALVEYDAANQTTAQTAATQATNAASSASAAATNASNAYTAANNANANASTAATQATTAASNTTYGGQSAAYWANQAATAATSNIIPVISGVIGQNGATCTTGTTFTANVAVSPGSSIAYTVTGVPGYSASGNSITLTGLSSGAYTATITATYTPTGKSCTYPFTFFKI